MASRMQACRNGKRKKTKAKRYHSLSIGISRMNVNIRNISGRIRIADDFPRSNDYVPRFIEGGKAEVMALPKRGTPPAREVAGATLAGVKGAIGSTYCG
ncbi:hypothetical protein [Burkholderia territorii]|uniref:hypothetical protein n=1 Tax=Burkholderia territorii TaxID=1503055 RepID=UPI003B972A0F